MRKIIPSLLTIILLLTASQLSAQQSSIEKQKQTIKAIEMQIAKDERAISSIRKDKNAVQNRVQSLARQVEQRSRLLGEQESQIKLIGLDIDSISVQSVQFSDELTKEREAYGAMVREAYRNYKNNNFVSYIFASESFNDVARRIVNIRRVAQMREQRIKNIDSLSVQLDSVRVALLSRKAMLDSVSLDIKDQKSKIERDIHSARSDISKMSSKERSALQAKALQERKLDSAIAELRRLSKGNTRGASFSTSTSNLNLPVVGGRVKRYMDNMAEITGAAGAGVISIYEGKVVDIKQNRITGKWDVYIAHGEYIASYAGLKSVSVAKNSSVKKNQIIGVVGAAVDVVTMNSEHKIIWGIYPPSPSQKMKAADCFKK